MDVRDIVVADVPLPVREREQSAETKAADMRAWIQGLNPVCPECGERVPVEIRGWHAGFGCKDAKGGKR